MEQDIFITEPTDEPVAREVNHYRIMCGKWYPVYRQEYGGYVFFKMPCGKSGGEETVYKNVSFRNKDKDTNIKNGTLIKPLELKEECHFSKADTKHYTPIWTVAILDWETREPIALRDTNALNEYRTTMNINSEELVNDDELPF